MSLLIEKFGGTSVGSAEALNQAASIVLGACGQWDHVVAVVSAMSGVTDLLVRAARTAEAGDDRTYKAIVSQLRVTHYRAVDALIASEPERAALIAAVDKCLDELSAYCNSVHVLGEASPRVMDAVCAQGEKMSARILAALLRARGARSEAVDATELVVTDDKYQSAAPLMEPTRLRTMARLRPLLDEGVTPVVTGFLGATEQGVTTTLGRGGSDYSAAILGDALDADEVWIWTDVDGVMTADPRVVPEARIIPELSSAEVSELAYFGAKVLHPRTIWPVVERGIPLWVKNTFNPACPGTRIAAQGTNGQGIKAVTAIKGLSIVTVEGRGMMGVPGIAARTFSAVAAQGASVLMITQASSEQSICLVVPADAAASVARAIESEMERELARRDINRVTTLDNVVIVTAVGKGLRSTPGVAARIFGALGRAHINVFGIAQGSSDCSVSMIVSADAASEAVKEIHREVIAEAGSGASPLATCPEGKGEAECGPIPPSPLPRGKGEAECGPIPPSPLPRGKGETKKGRSGG